MKNNEKNVWAETRFGHSSLSHSDSFRHRSIFYTFSLVKFLTLTFWEGYKLFSMNTYNIEVLEFPNNLKHLDFWCRFQTNWNAHFWKARPESKTWLNYFWSEYALQVSLVNSICLRVRNLDWGRKVQDNFGERGILLLQWTKIKWSCLHKFIRLKLGKLQNFVHTFILGRQLSKSVYFLKNYYIAKIWNFRKLTSPSNKML